MTMPDWWPFGGGTQVPEPTLADYAAAKAAAAAGSGGGNSISAPQGQANLVIPNKAFNGKKPPVPPTYDANGVMIDVGNWPWIGGPNGLPSPNSAAKPSTAAPAHFGSDDTGYWVTVPVSPEYPNGVKM